MVSIKLRASEHWSKMTKKRKSESPRLRGIVRKQATLFHSEMTWKTVEGAPLLARFWRNGWD